MDIEEDDDSEDAEGAPLAPRVSYRFCRMNAHANRSPAPILFNLDSG